MSLSTFGPTAVRALAITLAAAGVGLGGWWLYHSPLLSVRDIEVRGAANIAPEEVRQAADLDGDSIFRADFDAARERILALPAVKEAELTRDWPNGVTVSIVERQPWGVWQAGGRRYVIDTEGVVLDVPEPEAAPVIVQRDSLDIALAPGDTVEGGAVEAARQLAATSMQTLGRPVTALEFSQARGLTAVLGDGLVVTFGDALGYEFKVAALFAVLNEAQAEGRSLSQVDLRFGDRVAVQ